MATSLAIDAQGLIKKFGKFRALDEFDLHVDEGEVHGFLGPNGAGKSTTIRALLGQLRLDGGRARIFGQDCWSKSVPVHERLAYVPGDIALWDSLSGGECIDILVRLQGGGDPQRREELLERFELDPTKRTRSYSKGNRQKVALIAAFSKNADLFLLDEPTSGLDPLMEDVFQQCVLEERANGKTILLSSHILSEVERLCDRATIIRQGRTVSSGPIHALSGDASTVVAAVTRRRPSGLDRVAGLTQLAIEDGKTEVRVRAHVPQMSIGVAMSLLSACEIVSLTVEPPSLNELFLDVYRGDVPESPAQDATRSRSRTRGRRAHQETDDRVRS